MSYNNGNDLHYTSLQDIPSKAGQPINYHEITMGPRFTSFHPQFSAPASRNYALASGTAHGWGLGAYNMGNGPFLSSFNDVKNPRGGEHCVNSQEAVLTGASQCIDPATKMCSPPSSNGCAVGTHYIDDNL